MLGSTNEAPAEIEKSLSHSAQHLKGHLEYWVQFGAMLYRMLCGQAGERREQRWPKNWEACVGKWLRKLGLVSLEKRRLWRDLITMFQYLKGAHREDGNSLFTRSHMETTRGSDYKLLLRRFWWNTRGNFFTEPSFIGLISPREVVESKTLALLWFDRAGCCAILSRPCF